MEEVRGKRMQMVRVLDIEKRRAPSKHYVFVLEITWSDGTQNVVYRRYSQFFSLQTSLIDAFPVEGGVKNPAERVLPFLPGKVLFRSNVREVALKRKTALDEYCKNLVKLPEKILSCEHITSFFEPSEEDVSNFTDSLARDGSIKLKGDKKADVISDPVLLEQYIALSDFQKCGKGQVNLVAGDVVEVIEKSDNGWFFVNIESEQGWVPCSYLEPVDGSKENTVEKCVTEEKFVCVKLFKKSLDDEIDLELGAIVDVIQKGSDGWWEVRFKGNLGWAPRAHLKSAAHLNLSKQTLASGIVRDRESLRLAAGKTKLGIPPRRRTVRRAVPKLMSDARRESLATFVPESEYVAVADYHVNVGSTNINMSSGRLYTVIERAPNGWSLIKIDGQEGWVPSEILKRQRKESIMFSEDDDMYQNIRSLTIKADINNEMNNNFATQNGSTKEHYVTIGSYVSSDASGISFKEDVDVVVIERNESGWWYIQIGSDEGWAPSTYLKPIENRKEVKKTIVSGSDRQSNTIDISLGPPKPNRKSQIPQSYENVDVADGVKEESARIQKKKPNPKPKTVSRSSDTSSISPPIDELKAAFAKQGRSPNVKKSMSVEVSDVSIKEIPRSALRKISEPAKRPQRPEKGPSPVNLKGKVTPPRPVAPPTRQTPSPRDKGLRISPPVPTRPTPIKIELYETICDYSDDDEGMLSFKAGEKVQVLEKDEGGWWLAMIGVKKGWVPSNFLVKIEVL